MQFERTGKTRLTEREIEVLQFVSGGYSNAEIARFLDITERTVKYHVSEILRKLDVGGRTEAVVEAAVIGKPDPVVGNIVKAFVVLAPGALGKGEDPSQLLKKIQGHARKRLGAAVAPKEIEIVDQLPHTRSGKIMRRLLKTRELGLPEGDTSTLETP